MHRHDRLWLCSSTKFSQERAPCTQRRNPAQHVAVATADHCLRQKVPPQNHFQQTGHRTGGITLPAAPGTNVKILTLPTVRIMEPTPARDRLHYRIMEKERTANELKRLPIRGGNWNNGSNAGLAALNLNNARSNVNSNIGFRPALSIARNELAMADSTVHCKKDLFAMA